MKLKKLLFAVLLATALMGVMTLNVRSETTMIYVDHDPPEVPPNPDIVHHLQTGSLFNVTVNAANVIDLFSYGFDLNWTGSILEVINVYEGPFLKSGGSTIFLPQLNNTHNFVSVSCTLFFAPYGVTGNGTLAIIEFQVEDYGITDLQLYNTILKNSIGIDLIYSVVSGTCANMIPGDIMGDTPLSPPDGDVDGFDLGAFADAYGSILGNPKYNPLADLMGDTPLSPPDGDIDGFDLGLFADNYGKSI